MASNWLTRLGELFVPVQARSDYPNTETLVTDLWRRRAATAYRTPGVTEALGVPAIFGALSLIADTVGSLSLEAFRNGALMLQADAPRIVQRPNPYTTTRAFFRDSAWYLGGWGEVWWWTAARDVDGSALSVVPIAPWEIMVEANDRNRLRPTIKWGNVAVPFEDIRQITYMPGRDGRGQGPLQMCGAAVSVTVESQEWAANFFSGSIPSIIGTTEQQLTGDELELMDKQWNEKPPNMPRWLTSGLTMSDAPFNPEKAQLSQAREHQVGEAARMFNLPGALIEYQMGGSSLTYQNQADIWQDFQRRCLSPHYLEPIEQEMSDLLTRSTVARFNLKQLLRADPKTRMEVHTAAIGAGIYPAETAAVEEGYAPGNVDYAPVPFAPPQAFPGVLAVDRGARSAMAELHCHKCGRLAGRVAGSAEIKCQRCGAMVVAA